MTPNSDPRDGFFYPTLTLMTDSYINQQDKGWLTDLCLSTLSDLVESLCVNPLMTSLFFNVELGEFIGEVFVELAAEEPLLSLYSEIRIKNLYSSGLNNPDQYIQAQKIRGICAYAISTKIS